MKKNLWLSIASGALLVSASGCLKEKAQDDASQDAGINARAALIQALDNQAVNLVKGLNKVIIEGKFLENMALENPPEPIPMSDDNEIAKAIDYLLSNQTQQGESFTYTPDSKVCSEVMAKNNPATCIEVMKLISFTQSPANETDGILEVKIGNAHPGYFLYSSDAVSARATVAEIVKTVGEIDQVFKNAGNPGLSSPLPTTHEGAFELTAASFMSISSLYLSITSDVDLRGENENAEAYSLQIASAQNLISATLDSVTGIGTASAALPLVQAAFTVHDEQNAGHSVQVYFPGLTGGLTLNNSLESMAIEAIKLATPDAYVTVDGQAAAHFTSASQIDAIIQSYAGGDKSLSFASPISAQVDINTNALINGNGQLNASVAANTQLYFKFQSKQAKVTAGSVQLIGGGDFSGMMDAQQDSCIEGQQNGFPLVSVVCQ